MISRQKSVRRQPKEHTTLRVQDGVTQKIQRLFDPRTDKTHGRHLAAQLPVKYFKTKDAEFKKWMRSALRNERFYNTEPGRIKIIRKIFKDWFKL